MLSTNDTAWSTKSNPRNRFFRIKPMLVHHVTGDHCSCPTKTSSAVNDKCSSPHVDLMLTDFNKLADLYKTRVRTVIKFHGIDPDSVLLKIHIIVQFFIQPNNSCHTVFSEEGHVKARGKTLSVMNCWAACSDQFIWNYPIQISFVELIKFLITLNVK